MPNSLTNNDRYRQISVSSWLHYAAIFLWYIFNFQGCEGPQYWKILASTIKSVGGEATNCVLKTKLNKLQLLPSGFPYIRFKTWLLERKNNIFSLEVLKEVYLIYQLNEWLNRNLRDEYYSNFFRIFLSVLIHEI